LDRGALAGDRDGSKRRRGAAHLADPSLALRVARRRIADRLRGDSGVVLDKSSANLRADAMLSVEGGRGRSEAPGPGSVMGLARWPG